MITVQDVTAPVLAGVPADVTVECDAVPAPATPTASDNCDSDVTIDFNEVRTDGLCEDSYTLTRTWTATDNCGNTDIQSQVITVQDVTAPVLAGVPADVTVECDAVPAPATPTASDNCDSDVTIDFNEVRTDGLCEDTYTLTRTWTATDNCGNTDVQSQVITVQDVTAPQMIVGAQVPQSETDITGCISLLPEGPSENEIAALFTDNCGSVNVIKSAVYGENNSDCEWNVTYTYRIADDCGNYSDDINITYSGRDDTPPVILCPSDVTVHIDVNDPNAVVEIPIPRMSDDCSNVRITNSFNGRANASGVYPIGTTTVVYTAYDACGNSAICEFDVNVICDGQTRIDGVVYNPETDTHYGMVMVTLIPKNGTPGNIQLSVTNPDGEYAFVNMVPGDYLIQVQDANLNAKGIFSIDSRSFFTTIVDCNFQTHDFEYGNYDGLVMGDFVWYDFNGNGIQDEWFDANNDNMVTENIPDFSNNGYVDFSKWEWIDMNGDGSYSGPENEGELNKAGFGNALNPNIKVTGPNEFEDDVTISYLGYWNSLPETTGEYTATLNIDENLAANAQVSGKQSW